MLVFNGKRYENVNFLKTKARWVLRGFQDRQKDDQQTDSPTATCPSFRLACQAAVSNKWSLLHVDIKTAFLQGEQYDLSRRDVVCQLPPELGLPSYIGAILVKPAYGMNDAPRRWWNKLDGSLQRYGLVPTRADRCCYVQYRSTSVKHKTYQSTTKTHQGEVRQLERTINSLDSLDDILNYILDPIAGSPARGKEVIGTICLHVDDLFATGTPEFLKKLKADILTEFEIGSEASDNIMFVGQRVRWKDNTITVDQDVKIEELHEIKLPKGSRDDTKCDPFMHTDFRSVLGNLNWIQSRTQFHITYLFSRSASAAASPTFGDVKELNRVVRRVRAESVMLTFWPLKGKLRMLGYPDAAFKNNLSLIHI